MRKLIRVVLALAALSVSLQAMALPMENPSGLADLPDKIGCQGNGTGLNAPCGVPLMSFNLSTPGIFTATGTFGCQTFGCHDRADAFFITLASGFVINSIQAQTDPNDAERFRVGDGTIFDTVVSNSFTFTGLVSAGTYLVEAINGQQKNAGVFTGFGSQFGNWQMDFTVAVASPPATVPEPGTLLLLAAGLFAFSARRFFT